jgi:hypothetical protein
MSTEVVWLVILEGRELRRIVHGRDLDGPDLARHLGKEGVDKDCPLTWLDLTGVVWRTRLGLASHLTWFGSDRVGLSSRTDGCRLGSSTDSVWFGEMRFVI